MKTYGIFVLSLKLLLILRLPFDCFRLSQKYELIGWNDNLCGNYTIERPHMSDKESEYFLKTFQSHSIKNSIILEWGSGGSTNFLAWNSRHLTSIENSRQFCDQMALRNTTKCNISLNKLNYICMNHTNLKEWGMAQNQSLVASKRYRTYVEIVDRYFVNHKPDIVFVDGRFRVACILKGALLIRDKPYSASSGFILVHDYVDRRHYHVVENFLNRTEVAGTLAKLVIRPDVDWVKLGSTLEEFLADQN